MGGLLEVEGLKFKYTDNNLFNDVSFRILQKDHIVLVGDNGCGKSTFMNLIAKNLIPDAGKMPDWFKNIFKVSPNWLTKIRKQYIEYRDARDAGAGGHRRHEIRDDRAERYHLRAQPLGAVAAPPASKPEPSHRGPFS